MLPQKGDHQMMKLVEFTEKVVSTARMSLGMGCPFSWEYIHLAIQFSSVALFLFQMACLKM